MSDKKLYQDLLEMPYLRNGREISDGGLDCYGLVRELYRRLGVNMSDAPRAYKGKDIAAIALSGKQSWHPVLPTSTSDSLAVESCDPNSQHKLFALRPYNVIQLEIKGHHCHAGMVLPDRRFIHTWEGSGMVVIDRIDSPRWIGKVVGVYHP